MMDATTDVLLYCRELGKQALEAYHAAHLTPVRIAGWFAGCLFAAYSVYCVYLQRFTKRLRSEVSLIGRTVIITGANAGIGRETAVDLASRGARVIMACRNPTKAQAALAEVRRRSGNDNVVFRQVDISDLQSVRAFAEQILREEERLDILINNAGIGASGPIPKSDGFDAVMATNHMGHFLLTVTLVDLMKKSAPSRIVTVSSVLHTWVRKIDYSNMSAKGYPGTRLYMPYMKSKLANVHFTKELARRLAGTGVTAYSLHPGAIYTSIWEKSYSSAGKKFLFYLSYPILRFMFLNERDGAQTTIYCAIDENIAHLSGGYFSNCGLGKESSLAKDDRLARQLWDVSCEMTGIDPNKLPAKDNE